MEEENELGAGVKLMSWLRFHNKLNHELGQPEFEWEGLQEWEQDAWLAAFEQAQKSVAEAENASYDALARRVRGLLYREEMDSWQQLPSLERLKWKFMIRHLANLLIIDPEDDGGPEQHEDEMIALFNDHRQREPLAT